MVPEKPFLCSHNLIRGIPNSLKDSVDRVVEPLEKLALSSPPPPAKKKPPKRHGREDNAVSSTQFL